MTRKTFTISASRLAELKAKIAQLQPFEKQTFSRPQALVDLVSGIEDMRKKGYPLAKIAEYLTEQEFPITADTLSTFLRKHNAAAGSRTKSKSARKAPAPKSVATPMHPPVERPAHPAPEAASIVTNDEDTDSLLSDDGDRDHPGFFGRTT